MFSMFIGIVPLLNLLADLLEGYQLQVEFADKQRAEKDVAGVQDHIAFGFGMAVRRAQEFVKSKSVSAN